MKAIITTVLLSWFPIVQHSYSEVALLTYGSQFCVEVLINDNPCHLIVDTGSAYSFLHQNEAKRLGCKRGPATAIMLKDFAGGSSPLFFAKKLKLQLHNQAISHTSWYLLNSPVAFPIRNNIQPVGILGMDMLHLMKAKITFGKPGYLQYTLP